MNQQHRELIFRCCFFLFFLLSHQARAGTQETNLEALVQKAKQQNLSSEPQWLALLHYEKSLIGHQKSLAKNSLFFNSAEGNINPEAELEATLRNFFNPNGRKDDSGYEEPFRCAFIARYTWLSNKLNFNEHQVPKPECDNFETWFKALDAEGLSIIFPSAFMNNPASAFGHTLLRIDQKNQDEKTRLLAYSSNFAAITEGEGGFMYAINGVFGGYSGFFSIAPYYQKVNEYSDLEKRDIWEYQLNLNKQEVEFLLMHLWELRSIPFSYYYFDENCSYQLLSLFEVARPTLNLSQKSRAWVIPVDTVREVIEKDGLLKAAYFRPSLVTKLQARIDTTNSRQRSLAKQLLEIDLDSIEQSLSNISADDKAKVVDLAYEYLNFQTVSGDSKSDYQSRAYKLLKLRSDLPQLDAPPILTPEQRPDQGHLSSRLGIETGTEDGDWFYDLHVRPAYHDLLDPISGYAKGAQIEILDLAVRQYEQEQFKLQRATLLKIKSYSARNEFLEPLSWNLDLGMQRMRVADETRALTTKMNVGIGSAWDLNKNSYAYALFDVDNLFNSHFQSNYSMGIGPKFGFILSPSENWQIGPSISTQEIVVGEKTFKLQCGIEQSYLIDRNKALRLNLQHANSYGESATEISLAFDFYL